MTKLNVNVALTFKLGGDLVTCTLTQLTGGDQLGNNAIDNYNVTPRRIIQLVKISQRYACMLHNI